MKEATDLRVQGAKRSVTFRLCHNRGLEETVGKAGPPLLCSHAGSPTEEVPPRPSCFHALSEGSLLCLPALPVLSGGRLQTSFHE